MSANGVTKVQNEDINVIPTGDDVTATVSGTAQTFLDMGLDIADSANIKSVEFRLTEDCYIRRFEGKSASASNGTIKAGRYMMGREEALQASFLNVAADSIFTLQPFNYVQL